MRRIIAFAGCFSAGLIVFLAGPLLRADETAAGLRGLHSGNIPPVLLAFVPDNRPYIPPPRPSPPPVARPSAPPSTPRPSSPPPAARPSTPPSTPRPSTPPPAARPSTPPYTPRPSTPAPTPRPSSPPPAARPSTPAPTPRPSSPPPAARPSTPVPHVKTPAPAEPRAKAPKEPRSKPPAERPTKASKEPRSKPPAERPEKALKEPPSRGPVTGRTAGGGHVEKTPAGRGTYHSGDGKPSAKLQGARPTEVRRGDTVVTRPGGGLRTVVVHRSGNRVVVLHGAGHGYVQRPLTVGRHSYFQRTYYANGRPYVRAYRPYYYHGAELYDYALASYYPMAFYGWAMGPWDPLDYPWGWAGNPWFTHYGPFFRPYAVYRSPAFWLTDFLVSSTLQAAYLANREDPGAAPDESLDGSAPMSDDVKDMIAEEVRRQLAEAQSEAEVQASDPPSPPTDSLPPSFAGNGPHLFLASEPLEVENTASGPCQIREGDAIQLNGLPESGATAQVRVLASKGSDCPVGATVSVPLPDLVEMSNNMRENIEQGLQTLRDNQGANNLPQLPEAAAANPTMTRLAAHLAADPDAAGMIQEESHRADQLAHEVIADLGGVQLPAPGSQTSVSNDDARRLASLQIGQSENQVIAIMGQPLNTAFLGGVKKTYEYPAGKVVFTDGNLSEVEPAGTTGPAPAYSQGPAGYIGRTPVEQPGGIPGRTVTEGQTEAEVIAVLGEPLHVTFLGGVKKMYEYRNLKVVFLDGNVSEVQKQ